MSEKGQHIERSILVVTATSDDAEVFLGELSNYTGTVYTAYSPRDAIEIFKEKNPPIVILDDSLKRVDVVSLVKECCWIESEVLIVLAVKVNNKETFSEVIQSRVSGILLKPIDKVAFSDLLSQLTSAIVRREYKKFRADAFNAVELKLSLKPSSKSIENAVTLVSRFLSVAIKEQDLLRIELGLQEVIRNSFEHGCLGIDYDQKRELLERASFDSFVEEESQRAIAKGRYIDLEARYNANKVVIKIDDYGKGFDWKAMSQKMKSKAPDDGYSGRGLFLIERVFDEVSYNTKGNQTSLTINLS